MSDELDLFGEGDDSTPPEPPDLCVYCEKPLPEDRFQRRYVGGCAEHTIAWAHLDCPGRSAVASRAARDAVVDRLKRLRKDALDEVDRRLIAQLRREGRTETNSGDAYLIWRDLCREDPSYDDLDARFLGALWRRRHWRSTGRMMLSEIADHHSTPRTIWRMLPTAPQPSSPQPS